MKLWNEASNGVWPGKSFTRAPRWAPNVPDRTLGGIYLLNAKVMQWCVVMILLKFLIALGVVFICL
jgi:hypothetical protein